MSAPMSDERIAPAAVSGSLEERARQHPQRIALIEGERTLTFGEWNERADRFAQALAERGLQTGDVLVVRTQVRIEWAIVASAAAKLGCAILGLNWRLTPSETRYLVQNSGARGFVCDDQAPDRILPVVRDLPLRALVSIDVRSEGFEWFDDLLQSSPRPRFSTGRPSLIVYTSGTTGLPKGVAIGSRSPQFSAEQVEEYQADVRQSRRSAQDARVVLITMPMHHASGPAQVWAALHAGSVAVLMRRFDAEHALRLIQRHRVTDWNAVPTMLRRIAALPPATLAACDVSSLRRLSVGAAPVPYELKLWALDYFGDDTLHEGYGSTETSMVTHLPPSLQRTKPGSSGRPYRHVSIEIRNDLGRVLPVRSVGEVWVRTPVTLQQYLNSAPLGEDTLDRNGFFRTGDVGYVDEEGCLYITDRTKDLIISGGVNIYPAEIEQALQQHPDVLDAAVIGVPDQEFGEAVFAFIEPKPGAEPDSDQIAGFVAARLASYKRPKAMKIVRELPRNSMGKILKRELRDPFWKDKERNV
jgi:long-chain acyl-CoA synthetase